MPSPVTRSRARCEAAEASSQNDGPHRGDPPAAAPAARRSPLAARAEPNDAADAANAAAHAAAPPPPPPPPPASSPNPSGDNDDGDDSLDSLDYGQATAAIREAELSRVPLPRDHVAARRRPVISPTDVCGADWCQLRSAFRMSAPWLAARDELETAEMRRGKEEHFRREEAPPPGLTLEQAVALGLRGPDARVTVRPQTRADRVALRLMESASALAELVQFGRAREVWVFGRVPVPRGRGGGGGEEGQPQQQQQWLTGIVDQVERRPKGWARRAAAEGAAAARGEKVGVAQQAGGGADSSPAASQQQQRRRRRRSNGAGTQDEQEEEKEEEETVVTELKTRGGGGSAPGEAALRGAAMQAGLYRRLLAGLAREAAAEAEALLPPAGGGAPRPGGFLEAQGVVGGEQGEGPPGLLLSAEVAALVAEGALAAAALLPPPPRPSPSRAGRASRRRSSLPHQAAAAARSASPGGVIVLSADSPRAAPELPAPPPTLADALVLLSRLAATALPQPADHVRVEFVGQQQQQQQQQGEGEAGSKLLYGAWVEVPAAPGRSLARRAGRNLAFLRGLRAPTRRSGEPARDAGCRWCVFRERCAGLDGAVREDGDEEDEEDEGAALELF